MKDMTTGLVLRHILVLLPTISGAGHSFAQAAHLGLRWGPPP